VLAAAAVQDFQFVLVAIGHVLDDRSRPGNESCAGPAGITCGAFAILSRSKLILLSRVNPSMRDSI